MKAPSFLATLLLAGGLHAAALDLHGIVTDFAGVPLRGATVALTVDGRSTVTDANGAWRLASSSGVIGRNPSARSESRSLAMENGRLRLRHDGFMADGRFGGGTALPTNHANALARQAAVALDTICYGWSGVTFCQILPSTASGDLGSEKLDTAGWGRFELRALRFESLGLKGLGLSLVNLDVGAYDSLTLRLHLDGTSSEMADFATRVDLATQYNAAGFNFPAPGLQTGEVSKIRPKLGAGSCTPGGACSWIFDIPLAGVVLEQQARLSLFLLFDSHKLSGDTTELANRPASHDPYAGADWSFRPRGGVASEARYAGVPVLPITTFDSAYQAVPKAPYISVLRKGVSLYGTAP
jgi:hypothetical protein